MRVTQQSTFNQLNTAMTKQSKDLNTTLTQLASMKKINTPSENPVDASIILEFDNQLKAIENNTSNQGYAALASDDYMASLSNMMDNLQSTLEKTVQLQNGALQNTDWTKISTDITEKFNNILAFSNKKDSLGQYLFSGNINTTPFTGDVETPVIYHGDTGIRTINISENQEVQLNIPGAFLFNQIPDRSEITYNNAANARVTVTTPALITQPGTITMTGPNSYNFTDTNGTTTSGSFSGSTLNIGNLSLKVEGEFQNGDSFSITNPANSNLFEDMQELVALTKNMPTNDSDKNKTLSRINEIHKRLENHMTNISNHEVLMGGQAVRIQNQRSLDDDYSLNIKKNKSNLQDVDYATAITQLTSLKQAQEATRASYAKIMGLSLFDYLK